MKLNLTKAAAAVALTGGLLLAAPVAAQAYTTAGPNTEVIQITASGTYTSDEIVPGASATGTLSGRGVTQNNIATANLPVTSASVTKTADASGVVAFQVTLPAGASGPYTLAVTAPRVGAAGSGAGSNASGPSLPATGFDANSMLGIWVGGGALVLAGATIAVATTVRRNRAENKA